MHRSVGTYVLLHATSSAQGKAAHRGTTEGQVNERTSVQRVAQLVG
jgi:hypothetical protein